MDRDETFAAVIKGRSSNLGPGGMGDTGRRIGVFVGIGGIGVSVLVGIAVGEEVGGIISVWVCVGTLGVPASVQALRNSSPTSGIR